MIHSIKHLASFRKVVEMGRMNLDKFVYKNIKDDAIPMNYIWVYMQNNIYFPLRINMILSTKISTFQEKQQ